MENECIVSVIVPVHNTAGYLHKCVDSLRNQTLRQIEIILVDNLSTDGSSEMCDEYAGIDSRIKVLHLSVAGLSIARNAGIEASTASYIGFIDSDDYVEPTMFQEMSDALVRDNAEIAYCNFFLESDSGLVESPYQNSGNVFLRSSREVLKDILTEEVSCSACTKLYKKEFLSSLRFPEGRNYEDRLVMHEWIARCNRVVCVDKPFYHYVERQSSICHTRTPIDLYHYFQAEYARMQYMIDHSLFEGEELYRNRSRLVGTCFTIFQEIMMMVSIKNFGGPIKNMRRNIKEIASLPEGVLESRYHRKAKKISSFWLLYYLTHYVGKRK